MSTFPKHLKQKLGELLAKGHARFGKVAPRRPYRDDDDQGGEGGSQLVFETHPLLADQPVGAASDLTNLVSEYSEALEAAEDRAEEACPELQQQPVLQHALQNSHALRNFVKPSPRG